MEYENGNFKVCHDNRASLGNLYTYTGEEKEWDKAYDTINDLTTTSEWDVKILGRLFNTEVLTHILENVKPSNLDAENDQPYWMLSINGNFIVKSAWQYIRYKESPNKIYKLMLVKGLPFKMVFIMWRFWKFKVPVDDRVYRWGIEESSRY